MFDQQVGGQMFFKLLNLTDYTNYLFKDPSWFSTRQSRRNVTSVFLNSSWNILRSLALTLAASAFKLRLSSFSSVNQRVVERVFSTRLSTFQELDFGIAHAKDRETLLNHCKKESSNSE